jgi:glycine dehydrogenase
MERFLKFTDCFADRHIGPDQEEIAEMLGELGLEGLEQLVDRAVPRSIRMKGKLALEEGISEYEMLGELRKLAGKNRPFRSFIGLGYADCITPPVIQRNILENPGWYTQYTPYQAEISQGRLEALLNFQTMVIDLTGMEIANASLLDEATAAAEAMAMFKSVQKKNRSEVFFVSSDCHPQTIEVIRTRALARGWEIAIGDHRDFDSEKPVFGALLQYPTSDGAIHDYRDFIEKIHDAGGLVAVAADILGLCLLTPPGEFGADAVVGTTQRFGMPIGYGGPHAAFFATRQEFKRLVPGRIIGASIDVHGNYALRMALQTREQHIRRERATSNICTAQVLPAVVASMYAVYHGPAGLEKIALRTHQCSRLLEKGIEKLGFSVVHEAFFDTLRVRIGDERMGKVLERTEELKINLRRIDDQDLGITVDETIGKEDLEKILSALEGDGTRSLEDRGLRIPEQTNWAETQRRKSAFLTHPVFNSHHSETEMVRYMNRLQEKDLSLKTSMTPLGSCTMKLNATTEMMPITWPEFTKSHPFAPVDQAKGYQTMFAELEEMLREITGFAAVSLQPNAGAQGEFAGLLVIRKFHEENDQADRNICLIPASAHGTNPASAIMAGMEVVVVKCDEQGNVDLEDLRLRAKENAERLAALMVTYPSTHGVFEEEIREICGVVHEFGGQVYMDGANLNALVGLCRPGEIGVDVCHLNLHKTFCIPHGGGGPGMGPIAVAAHLADFLPTHPLVETGGSRGVGPIAAAPWGSALILLISWAYLKMIGGEGVTRATEVAILNANYVAHRLNRAFPILYQGKNGLVAHEAILDLRHLKGTVGITVEDIAKRLMDYGFHSPTISFPVVDTVMIEPTESEAKGELDRFCQAMMAIRQEIEEIERGGADREDNLLKNAPHTVGVACSDDWQRPYSRQRAVFPMEWLRNAKFWPSVGRIDNAQGDRNLVCSCAPVEAYAEG